MNLHTFTLRFSFVTQNMIAFTGELENRGKRRGRRGYLIVALGNDPHKAQILHVFLGTLRFPFSITFS